MRARSKFNESGYEIRGNLHLPESSFCYFDSPVAIHQCGAVWGGVVKGGGSVAGGGLTLNKHRACEGFVYFIDHILWVRFGEYKWAGQPDLFMA